MTRFIFALGVFLAAFTTLLYAATGGEMVEGIAPWLNLALTSGILLYAVRIEHRITKLETTVELKLVKR